MSFTADIAQYVMRAARSVLVGTGRVNVTSTTSLFGQMMRVGGDLNPRQVSWIYQLADAGYMWRLIDLANECRQKDCHLHACLSTLELSIVGLECHVTPASDSAQDLEIGAFAEEILRDFGQSENLQNDTPGTISDLIERLVGAYYYGYDVNQLLWEKRDGQMIPVGFEPVPARRFVYDQLTSELRFFDAGGDVGSSASSPINLMKAFPGHYIQFEPRVTGGGPAREGLLRMLVFASILRTWTMKEWMALVEMAGKPWRIGKYKKESEASGADQAMLLTALEYLTTKGATMLPDSVDLKIEWPTNGSGTGGALHPALVDKLEAGMSKAILGQTETTDAGSGTKAVSSVHNEVRKDRRDAMARAIAGVIRWQIVARAVRLNYGAKVAIPNVSFVAHDTTLTEDADLLLKLCGPKGIGLQVPAPWVYSRFGITPPKPGEEVLGQGTHAVAPGPEEKKRIATLRTRIRLVGASVEEQRTALAEAEAEALLEREQIERAVNRPRITRR